MRGYRRNKAADRKKRISFAITTLTLVLVTMFCTAGTVIGQGKDDVSVDEKYYREMERDYVKQVRSYLNDNGYENSGVALTKVLEADGSREYTLSVHHKRIERLEWAEQESLRETLKSFATVSDEFPGIQIGNIYVVF